MRDTVQTPEDDTTTQGEYRYIEYETEHETLTVIQDERKQSAWVQSTVSVPVER